MTEKLYYIRKQGMVVHKNLPEETAVGYSRSILHSADVGMKIDILDGETGNVVRHMRTEIIEEENGVSPEKVLSLSTAHMPCQQPDFGDPRVAAHEFGHIVFVCAYAKVPEWFRPIWKHAQRIKECTLIMFDRDAVVWEDVFETYEW